MSRLLIRIFLCTAVAVTAGRSPLCGQEALPTPAAAWQKLKDGNGRFASDKPAAKERASKRRAELAGGQYPFAVILACADSRVAPELIFDQGLGDLFMLRLAGNIADPAVVGSIEYAVEHLKAPLVVVLGHEHCGAVAAAVAGKPLAGALGWLVKQIHVGDDLPADRGKAVAAGVRANGSTRPRS